jgi:hypothetical protein
MIAMENDEFKKMLREVADNANTPLDDLISELIEVAVSQKYKSGGNNSTRRDYMEKIMNEHLSNNKEE